MTMSADWISSGSCAVIAHRGGARLGRENSVEVLPLAAAAGADAVEIDIRELGDDSLVLAHDPIQGRGPRRVSSAEIDIGTFVDSSRGPVALLDDLIERLEPLHLGLYLDVKGVTRDGLQRALDRISTSMLAGRTVVGSFDVDIVAAVAEDGRLPAAVLYRDQSVDPVDLAAQLGCTVVHPCFDDAPFMVDRLAGGWMERVHRAGLAAVGWSSNEPSLLAKMVDAGFDAVCTDDPRLM